MTHSVTAHPLSKGSLRVKYETDWVKEKKYIYDPDKDFKHRSAMTLTFDPEVGSISLHTFYTYWVKYEQDWVNWTQNPDL